MPGDLELAVTPTPVSEETGDRLHPVAGATFADEPGVHERARRQVTDLLGDGSDALVLLGAADRSGAVASYLESAEIDVDWAWLGREGYRLDVRIHDGRLVILIAANTREGVLWGVQTLRQITWKSGGRAWVRGGVIRDRPALPDRGSKRPRAFESLYKANFAWQIPPERQDGETERRRYVPSLAPGERLDASDRAVEETLRFFREWSFRGSRAFALRFDDVDFLLDRTSGTDERYGGDYALALVDFLRRVRDGVREFDRGARLYWLPQTYHESHPRLEAFAREIAEKGGLPADLGLVVTGPRIISPDIPVQSVRRMRRLFGLTETPALIYDNRGRDRDFTPLRGRDPDLTQEVSGVFGERGTSVNRITRLDWNWNPAAYRPERSLLLAVRDLVGPEAFAPTLELVRALGDGTRPATPERTARLAALLAKVEAAWPKGRDREFLEELKSAIE